MMSSMCCICSYASAYRWRSSNENPSNEDQVLAIINGTRGHSTFINSYALACYIDNHWIIDGYEGVDTLRVDYWTELPSLPECIKR